MIMRQSIFASAWRSALPLLLVAVALSTGAAAWDCVGHMMTAMVALERSSDEVKAALQPLFDYAQHRYVNQSVNGELACWPDDIKSLTHAYSSWHYKDTCYNPTGFPCPSFPSVPNDATGRLWIALDAAVAKVSDGSVALSDRSFWFTYMLHLAGDAHQPMHVTTLYDAAYPHGDLSGNWFFIYYEGERYKLHGMADAALDHYVAPHLNVFRPPPRPVATNQTYWAMMQAALKRIMDENPITAAEAADLSYDSWTREGVALAGEYMYQGGALKNASTVNSTYWSAAQAMLRRRVVLGGARLATMLAKAVAASKPAPPLPGTGSKTAAIVLAAVIAAVVVGLVVAAVVKRGSSRRRHVELVEDMPYETNRID